MFGDYFLYKGHILKAKQGEWGVADAINEFERDNQPPFTCDVSLTPELMKKADKLQQEQWRQIRKELGIEENK